MPALILQIQLLLATLSALIPLVPARMRSAAGDLLRLASDALALGASATHELEDLAAKLAALRAEMEAIAASGREISSDDLDAAMQRVRIASAAFRDALAIAGA